MNYTGKYVTSPIDGNEYCRKNGEFLRHLRAHNFEYQSMLEHFHPELKQLCQCGKVCSFVNSKMSYRKTCGDDACYGKVMSDWNRNVETHEARSKRTAKFKQTQSNKSAEELNMVHQRRMETAIANDSYTKAVGKRNATRLERYGDEFYNNPEQISETKLNWTLDQLNQFKERWRDATQADGLTDFHTPEMFDARRRLLESRGKIVPLDQLSEWHLYRREARNLTERVYRAHKNEINPHNLTRSRTEYELDHILPVFLGFRYGIPPQYLADRRNLQMLSRQENGSKGVTLVEPMLNEYHINLLTEYAST